MSVPLEEHIAFPSTQESNKNTQGPLRWTNFPFRETESNNNTPTFFKSLPHPNP